MATIKNLSRSTLVDQTQALNELAAYAKHAPMDKYGSGVTASLENRLSTLFGKEDCVVMPSGKAAQNIALKIWSVRSGSNLIAMHPRSHIEEAEGKAYAEVFGLRSVALGANNAQAKPDDLITIKDKLGAATVEIALRPLGGRLIEWSELKEMSAYCKSSGIPFHADGARIWESQHYYGKDLAQIAALFDTLYVSLYKVIGGFFGGALLGAKNFIDEARVWQQRLGQTPYRQFSYVLSAHKGLDENLPKIEAFCEKAGELSVALSKLDGVAHVTPRPAHTNMFQVHINASTEQLLNARDSVAKSLGINLFDDVFATAIEGVKMFEVHVGSATLELGDDQIIEAMELLIAAIPAAN